MHLDWGRRMVAQMDRRTAVWLASGLILVFIYFWHLGNLPLRSGELANKNSSLSAHQLGQNAVAAPQRLVYLGLHHLNHASAFDLRAVSAIFCLLFIFCFYLLLRQWFGSFCGWLGAMIFACTPLLILVGRSASVSINVLWPLALVAAYMQLVRSRNVSWRKLLALLVVAAICAYEPGGLLALLAGGIYGRKHLRQQLNRFPREILGGFGLLLLVLLVPLIYSATQQPAILKQLVFLPQSWPKLETFAKTSAWSLLSYFWRSQTHHTLQIGRLAILNALQIVLVVFGAYGFWSKARKKVYELAPIIILAALAAGLNNNYRYLLVGLPPLVIVATAGLRFLHIEWTGVFPRNPLPRGLAITLLVALVVLQVYWGAHYSLTAWPHSFIG